MDLSQLFDSVTTGIGFWAWPAGAVGLAILSVLALWMGAALAGVEKLTFLKALWIAPLLMGLLIPVAYAIFYFLVSTDLREWVTLQNLALGLACTLAVDLILIVGSLALVANSHPVQSLILWLVRLPVLAMLAALVSGGVFISIAIYQAANEPRGQVWLIWIGLIFAGIVVLALALFFGTRMTQSASGGARRRTA